MKLLAVSLLSLALLAPAAAQAQVVTFRLQLPEVPPLVVIEPGIQVVEDHDEEIFFHDSWYWVRRDDGRWFRSRHPHHEFGHVETRFVPAPLVRFEPGRYRHWRRDMRHDVRHDERRRHEKERHMRDEERRRREAERRHHEEERRHHDMDRRHHDGRVHDARPVGPGPQQQQQKQKRHEAGKADPGHRR